MSMSDNVINVIIANMLITFMDANLHVNTIMKENVEIIINIRILKKIILNRGN